MDVVEEAEAWARLASEVVVGGEAVAVVDVPPAAAGTATAEDRPPLLVLHGFPTSSIDFRPVLAPLSQRRRVVLLDFPGYGLSAKPDRPYSLFGQADVVAEVAAATKLDEVDLLTHDMGDSVGGELLARSLAGRLDLRIRRRVLTNGSIYLDMAQLTDGQKLLRQLPDEILPQAAGVDAQGLTEALVALCAPRRRDGPERDEIEARLRVSVELVRRDDGHRLLARLIRYIDERAQHEARWTGAIEVHPAPLTVVWGRHDPIAVAGMAERLVERRPDARLVWLEAGHWPMVELPDAFADAVLDALDSSASVY